MHKTIVIPILFLLALFVGVVLTLIYATEIDAKQPTQQESPKSVLIKVPPSPVFREDRINGYATKVSRGYNVSPELVQSMIYHESRYDEHARNGNCVGLMQINSRYHLARAKKLGVTDLSDPYSNILVGTDYLAELLRTYNDPVLALMIYNSGTCRGMSLYNKGKISKYARKVLAREKQLKAKTSRGRAGGGANKEATKTTSHNT